MAEHPDIGDNHNAPVFRWCYKRMGEFIPQLIDEGARPRVMLEYSGTLLYGLRDMGAHDVIDSAAGDHGGSTLPRRGGVAGVPLGSCRRALDTSPGLPVACEGVAAVLRRDVRARGAGASAGLLALRDGAAQSPRRRLRVRPHPEGLRIPLGARPGALSRRARRGLRARTCTCPTVWCARNSRGDSASIIALVKTQGSDTKLVGQMQPYYEARGLGRSELGGRSVPPLVTQIADGENGGVMMNEFPPKYFEVVRESSWSATPMLNGTEYLERLEAMGVSEDDLPVIQPLFQHRIWSRMSPGDGPERLSSVIDELGREDDRFHMEGGSWTNNISWVRGYESLLRPMDRASAAFNEGVLERHVAPTDRAYRDALFHLLTAESSDFRYWGRGEWTDYGVELARRTTEIVAHDF